MKKKYKVMILSFGILLMISIMVSISYAYYIFSVSQSTTNVVRADCFEITFNDGNAVNISNGVPLSDEEAMAETPYTFTIKNVCNHAMNYDINVETLNSTNIDLNVVDFKLNGSLKKNLGSISNNDSSVIVNKSGVASSKTIYSNVLTSGEEKTFKLKFWVDEDATIEQSANKSFSSKVVINTSLITDYKEAILDTGKNVNAALKKTVGINDSNYNPTYNDPGGGIASIVRSLTPPPDIDNSVLISDSESPNLVYAWFDNGTIYIYSDANRIYMNSDSSYMFYYFPSLKSLDLTYFDTSNVTDFSCMFYYGYNLDDIDFSNFNTSNATNMSHMFYNLTGIENLDISSFDTSNVTDMSYMFYNMPYLKSLDVSNFNTSKVTDMSYMFYWIQSINSLNLRNFDTSHVTNMKGMFFKSFKLTNLDVSSFDTSHVTNMEGMFSDNLTIKYLDISSFDTSNVENVSGMFYGSGLLKTIIVGDNWNMSSVTNSQKMFYIADDLIGGSNTAYDSNYIDASYAKVDCAPTSPGYFTYKGPLGDTAAYCAAHGY